jgi:acetyl esterase/lipase
VPQNKKFPWLRFTLAVLCFGLSLLTIFAAPTYLLWEISILATEWGHWLAVLSLLLFIFNFRRSRLAAALCLLAAVLAITPLIRALPVAASLPASLQAALGATKPNDLTRVQPLNLFALFRGFDSREHSHQNLIYAQLENQTLRLDFYPPANPLKPAPCVIVIHGGSWRSGDSRQLAPLNSHLAARGYAVASINYRLAPRWRFPAAHEDVIAAFNFLRTRADSLHLDPERFVLLGRSAGGHLALLAAYTLRDPAIRGVISFYGPTDLHWSYANPGNPLVIDTHNILHAFLGGSPQEVSDIYDAASPLRFVNASTPPTLLIHGGRDELVSIRHSERLAESLVQNQVPHFLLHLPWATHGADFNFSGPFGQMSTYAIERFLFVTLQTN